MAGASAPRLLPLVLAGAGLLLAGVLILRTEDDPSAARGDDATLLEDRAASADAPAAGAGSAPARGGAAAAGTKAASDEEIRARGPLPRSVQVAQPDDWQRALREGDADRHALLTDLMGGEAPAPEVEGAPPPEPDTTEIPHPDGDLLLRLLDEAFGGRLVLRFQDDAQRQGLRYRRLGHPIPRGIPPVALIDIVEVELGYRVLVHDGALYLTRDARRVAAPEEDR